MIHFGYLSDAARSVPTYLKSEFCILLIPLCGLDFAHARHNSNKFDSALAYSQSSLYSVLYILHTISNATTAQGFHNPYEGSLRRD